MAGHSWGLRPQPNQLTNIFAIKPEEYNQDFFDFKFVKLFYSCSPMPRQIKLECFFVTKNFHPSLTFGLRIVPGLRWGLRPQPNQLTNIFAIKPEE